MDFLHANAFAVALVMVLSISCKGIDVPQNETQSIAKLFDGDSSGNMVELVVSGTLTCENVTNLKISVSKITIADGGQFICDLSQDPDSQLMIEMSGAKEIVVNKGGSLSMNGSQKLPWTRLADSVKAGDTTLTIISKAPSWSVGDEIAIVTQATII